MAGRGMDDWDLVVAVAVEAAAWIAMRKACAGRIDSVVELRAGRRPDNVAEVVTDLGSGLFPQPGDIVASCEWGDTTVLCKHGAAVLWGIGSRLDERPELLFLLRGVDESELIAAEAALSRDPAAAGGLEPGATRGAAASKSADSRPLNTPRAATSTASLSAPPPAGSTAPSRPVKKTLTYRPPGPTDGRRRPAPSDLAGEAAGFVPRRHGGRLARAVRMSVTEFADLIQVTPTTVRRWETTPGRLNLHAFPREALRALYRESRAHQGRGR